LAMMPSTLTTPATAAMRGFTKGAPGGGAARCRLATAPTATGYAARCPAGPRRTSRTSSGSSTATSRSASGRPPAATPWPRPSRTGCARAWTAVRRRRSRSTRRSRLTSLSGAPCAPMATLNPAVPAYVAALRARGQGAAGASGPAGRTTAAGG